MIVPIVPCVACFRHHHATIHWWPWWAWLLLGVGLVLVYFGTLAWAEGWFSDIMRRR